MAKAPRSHKRKLAATVAPKGDRYEFHAFSSRVSESEFWWLPRNNNCKSTKMTKLTTFICFQQLPFELQLDIWELAVPKPELINFQNHTRDGPIRTSSYPTMLHLCRSSRDVVLRHFHHMIVELDIWPSCRSSASLGLRPPRTLIFAPHLDTIYLSRHTDYNPLALIQNGEDDLKLKKFIISLGEISVKRIAISMSLVNPIDAWGIGPILRDPLLQILLYHTTIQEIVFVAKANDLRSRDIAEHYVFSTQSYLTLVKEAWRKWLLGMGNDFLRLDWPSSNPLVLGNRPADQAVLWMPPSVCAMTEDRLLELFR